MHDVCCHGLLSGRSIKCKFYYFFHSDQIYEQGRPDSPRSGVMSRYDMGPRTMFGQRGRPIDNRRNLKDCVEIEIDGQMKGWDFILVFSLLVFVVLISDICSPSERQLCLKIFKLYHIQGS